MENKKITKFIEYCSNKHNNKYDYSRVTFKTLSEKIEIICPQHGSFFQIASQHKIYGCRYCSYEFRAAQKRTTMAEFLKRCELKHNNIYDYSLIDEIKNTSQKIEIICKKHGVFTQSVEGHMSGQGCMKCYREIQGKCNILTQEFVISKLKEANDDYSFDNVHYINSSTKINVTCKKHGDFSVNYHNFLKGSGCPRCKESKGEAAVRLFLEKNNIKYNQEFRVVSGNTFDIFDFYLPEKNIFIEFQGKQHYTPTEFFGGLEAHVKQKYRDLGKLFITSFEYDAELIEVPFYYIDRVDEYLEYKLCKVE